MRIFLITLLLCLISMVIFYSCKKIPLVELQQNVEQSEKPMYCASDSLFDLQMSNPVNRKNNEQIEAYIYNKIKSGAESKTINGVITIPIIFYVLWRTQTENISIGQIQSQIDVLNEDFNARNPDTSKTPTLFKSLIGNTGITFVLDTIIRKKTDTISWKVLRNIQDSTKGGITGRENDKKYNVWIATLQSNLLGVNTKIYSYTTNSSGINTYSFPTYYGTIISNRCVGSKAKFPSGYYPLSNYTLGRTLTHETGHWGFLRHIWGSGTCGDDLVDDTPQANTSNTGCPTFPHYSTCTGTPIEMTMNYMDYVNDGCMYMFSKGQALRVKALFDVGGIYQSFR